MLLGACLKQTLHCCIHQVRSIDKVIYRQHLGCLALAAVRSGFKSRGLRLDAYLKNVIQPELDLKVKSYP